MVVCFVNLSSEYGGGENQTFVLAVELLRKGVEVVAVVNPKSKLAAKFQNVGIPTVLATNLFAGHFAEKLRAATIVHAHDGRAVHWAAIHNAIFKKPFIITRRVLNPLKRSVLTRWSYSKANKLIGISSVICSVLLSFSNKKDIRCIPDSPVSYPIDERVIREMREKYTRSKFVVIQAGALREHKAFDVSIQAARILALYKDIVFLLLGEGPEEQKLKNQARDLSNVEFLGKKQDMGNWFKVADCLILPSRKEGLGSVLLEAMLAEVPVIASNAGGIPDLVKDGKTGLLIAPNDPQALADKILELYSNADLRRRLSENAKNFVLPLRIETIAKIYIKIYEEVISSRSTR